MRCQVFGKLQQTLRFRSKHDRRTQALPTTGFTKLPAALCKSSTEPLCLATASHRQHRNTPMLQVSVSEGIGKAHFDNQGTSPLPPPSPQPPLLRPHLPRPRNRAFRAATCGLPERQGRPNAPAAPLPLARSSAPPPSEADTLRRMQTLPATFALHTIPYVRV